MLVLPETLTARQASEIREIRGTEGLKHIIEPIKVTIDLAEKQLLYWEWERDDNGAIKSKSVIAYEKVQMEMTLLRELLAYISNDDIIVSEDGVLEGEDREVFDNTSK